MPSTVDKHGGKKINKRINIFDGQATLCGHIKGYFLSPRIDGVVLDGHKIISYLTVNLKKLGQSNRQNWVPWILLT